jgi:hypothetical protein
MYVSPNDISFSSTSGIFDDSAINDAKQATTMYLRVSGGISRVVKLAIVVTRWRMNSRPKHSVRVEGFGSCTLESASTIKSWTAEEAMLPRLTED